MRQRNATNRRYVLPPALAGPKIVLLEVAMSVNPTRTARPAKRRSKHPLHLFPGRFTTPGTAPGDLTEPPGAERVPTTLHLLDYDASGYTERPDCSLEEAREYFTSPNATWLHVNGTPSEELLRAVGDAYGLHPLALEDVMHTGQRAKLEAYDAQLFTIVTLPEAFGRGVSTAQLSLFLGDTWLVSFYSGREDPFDAIRQRSYLDASRIRKSGVDYLYYSLLDTAIDLVFPIMESLGERIEAVELTVFDDPSRQVLDEIQKLKRELVLLRRITWPQRDMLNSLVRDELDQVSDDTKLYIRDCYDHAVHALDLVESYREMASSLLEVYLSSLSNRMNDVMKLLTIIATVFIPLSFIVGVYGMNFDRSVSAWNMPELGWRFGYPILWLVMAALVAGMLLYFRRKDWI
jgi:magnesium transporter